MIIPFLLPRPSHRHRREPTVSLLALAVLWFALSQASFAEAAEPPARARAQAAGANDGQADARLVRAAEAGDAAAVKRLIAEGAAINARDGRGRTALLAATHANRVDAARVLLDAGADVNLQDDIQDSAFLYAGAQGRLEILRLMLRPDAKSKPDFRVRNRYGGNALIPACHYGHVETVRELLKTTIDVNHVNNLGWTALLETVILGDGSARYVEIARLLLTHGANASIADRNGVTPLAHARSRGHADLVRVIEQAGR